MRVEAQPQDGEIEWLGEQPWRSRGRSRRRLPASSDRGRARAAASAPQLFAGLLILLALGWIGASVYALTRAWPGPSLPAWLGWAATLRAPLILHRPALAALRPQLAARDAAFHRGGAGRCAARARRWKPLLAVAATARRESGGAERGIGAADEPWRRGDGPDRPGHQRSSPARPPSSTARPRRSTRPPRRRGSISAC